MIEAQTTVHTSESEFIAGLDLCEAFYRESVEPILRQDFPDLRYAAALIGSGSEVLGYDTQMSADHHWGPRVMLFLREPDATAHRSAITQELSTKLPHRFHGYPTSFSSPDLHDKGVQILDYTNEGPVNHRVSITSTRGFIDDYLAFDVNDEISSIDWLTFPDQKLLTITAGRVFHDDVGLEDVRTRFKYYPHDVWLYLLASQWTRIEQEEHLMGRAGLVGDEIGSAIIASRLVRDMMRLCFLMEKRYAPYPKWFGTAFRQLGCAAVLEPIFRRVLAATTWNDRQTHLALAYEHIATKHNQLAITAPLPTTAQQFHDRPFIVISMGAFSQAICAKLTDPALTRLRAKPLIGSPDQFSDSTDLLSSPIWRPALRGLYCAD
ncbi:MAG TPA: DUF4037 domain-containing protein [Trichormus sp.]|jgi:hypothetical protein